MHTLPTIRQQTKSERHQLRLLIEPDLVSATNWRAGVNILLFLGNAGVWVLIVAILAVCGIQEHYTQLLLKFTPLTAIASAQLLYYKVIRFWIPRFIIKRSKYASDYMDAHVHEYHYAASKAIRLVCSNANGSHDNSERDGDLSSCYEGFVLDIGHGWLLFISGAFLEKSVTTQQFPNYEFVVTRLPNTGEILNIQLLGQPLGYNDIQISYHQNWDITVGSFVEMQGSIDKVAEELCSQFS